jgi:hypothetical protein
MENFIETLKSLSKDGYAVSLVTNDQGYRETAEQLQTKLDSLDTSTKMHFLVEVYEEYFVYQVRNTETGEATLYKRDYSTTNSNVEFVDNEPVQVRKKVEYVNYKMRRTTPSTNNKNEKSMACCEDKVDRLIANKLTRYSAEDKEWLMGLKEEQISKLEPMEPEKPEEETIQVNKDEVIDEFKKSLKSIDDYTAMMPEEMQEQVSAGVVLFKERRDELVSSILTNTAEGTWEKEDLEAMETRTLERIEKSVTPVDYSGLGAPESKKKGGVRPMVPVQFQNKKKKEE